MTDPVRQISVDQQAGGNYPLVIAENNLDQLIADLLFYYVDETCQFVPPFRLYWLGGFGVAAPEGSAPTHTRDVIIYDSQDAEVFDSSAAEYTSSSWGDDTVVSEWRLAEQILRVVQHTHDEAAWSSSFFPDNAILDPRTLHHRTKRLDKLVIATADGDVEIQDDAVITFAEGYNMTLTPSTSITKDGAERQSDVLLEVIPGSGLGQYPGCVTVEELRELGDIQANAMGAIGFQLDQCYRQDLVVADYDGQVVTIEEGKLKISQICSPCARCEDFFAVFEALRRLHIRANAAGKRIDAIRTALEEALERWQVSSDCRVGSTVRLMVIPIGNCRVAVGGAICNNTQEPLRDVSLTFTLTTRPEGAGLCVECRTVLRKGNYDGTTDIPTSQWQPYKFAANDPYRADFDCISPGDMGSVVFQLKFQDAEDNDQVSITASVTGMTADPVSRSAELACSTPRSKACCEATTTTKATPPAPPTTTSTTAPTEGTIAIISRGSSTLLRVKLVPRETHSLRVGDPVTIAGTSVTAYNGDYKVVSVPANHTFVIKGTFTTVSTGGTYEVDPSPPPPVTDGTIATITHRTTFMLRVTLNPGETHSFIGTNEPVTIAGSSVPAYNVSSHVTEVISDSVFVVAGTYTSDATGGTFEADAVPPPPDPPDPPPPIDPPAEGSWTATVSNSIDGFIQLNLATTHNLTVGTRLSLSQIHLPTAATVIQVVTARIIVVTARYSDYPLAAGWGTATVRRAVRQHGMVDTYERHGSGQVLITVSPVKTSTSNTGSSVSLYGFYPGDFLGDILISGSSNSAYNGTWHQLLPAAGAYTAEDKKFLLDANWTGAAAGGTYKEWTVPDPPYTGSISYIKRFTNNTAELWITAPDPQVFAVGDTVRIKDCSVGGYNGFATVTFVILRGTGVLELGLDIPYTTEATDGTWIRMG